MRHKLQRAKPMVEQLNNDFEKRVISAALATYRPARLAKEREILRVVATIHHDGGNDVFVQARREVLKWARNRAGVVLPTHAWQGVPFEALAAGRTTMGAVVESDSNVLWSLRGDDPDKTVPGRIWSTEITLGREKNVGSVLLGVRLLVSFLEKGPEIEPAVPGLVVQISNACALSDGPIPISCETLLPRDANDVDTLISWVSSSLRRLPIVILTGDERTNSPSEPPIDTTGFARAMCGLAHVVFVPAPLTYKLSNAFGRRLTVFHGGIRVYLAGFNVSSEPRDHPLYLGETVANKAKRVITEIKSSIAQASLRLTRLGHDVLSFAEVRTASLRMQQAQAFDGATESQLLNAANTRNEALESENQGLRSEAEQSLDLSVQEAERAEDAERQLASAHARIERLEAALASEAPDEARDQNLAPDGWDDFCDWCDSNFSSRLAMTPSARRATRTPTFSDFNLASRCIQSLVDEARQRFLDGGGTIANIPVFEGITNAPCGKDEFYFNFQGRRLLANWHLKNGGNTRSPERCLRIYYCFDDVSRQIIVADMPAHRRTGAT